MYKYSPRFEKKKEKLLAWFLTALGIILYITARIPGAPFPAFIQTAAVGCLAGMILLVSMCVMRSFDYTLEQNENGQTDFTVTEYYGRRTTVVCRVALHDVESVTPYDPNWKKGISNEKITVYSYTGLLFDEKRYLIEINAHDEHFFVIICADVTLLKLLTDR